MERSPHFLQTCYGPLDKKSRFSLCMAVLFYKLTANTKLVNTEPLLLGKIQS